MKKEIINAAVAAILSEMKGDPPTATPTVTDDRIGHPVIVRANRAGVYCGVLLAFKDGDEDLPVLDKGSRQLHYWAQGGSCAQIATHGIGTSDQHRVTSPSEHYCYFGAGTEVVSVYRMTDGAWRSVLAAEEWKGGVE